MRLPFQERNSRWRGALDLLSGCYPAFLFGGGLGRSIPVFHFHECHPSAFEPYLQYLADNGYRTVDSDAIASFVLKGIHPGAKSVAICFDDAWSSLWVCAAPLLKKYNFRAITFVSPGRVPSLPSPRPQWDGQSAFNDAAIDRSGPMFSSWCELREMHNSGLVDIQAHSLRHAQIFCDPEVTGFVRPDYKDHPHQFPLVDAQNGVRFVSSEDLGAPLYSTRSRLSDALRWVDPESHKACVECVQEGGGADFFNKADWCDKLMNCIAHAGRGRWETEQERDDAILEELVVSREQLSHELQTGHIKHMCFPWAIAGPAAVRLAQKAGYETAFSDRMWGSRVVRRGHSPYQLMRLKHQWIFSLPGKGRVGFFGKKHENAATGLKLGPIGAYAVPVDSTQENT